MNKNLVVTKSNKVIEASYKLNLNEQRILLSCISQHNSRNRLKKDDEFILTAKDYSRFFDIDLKNSYREIKEGAENLFERHLWFKNPESGNPVQTRWVSSVEYGDGEVKIHFAQKIIPYLSELSDNFTTYRLSNVVKLTSTYSIRLYEMLMQWKKIGRVTFEIESFRKSLGIKKSEYKRMFDFKKYVLNFAVAQINDFTDIKCNYIEVKKGRKITGFEFRFGENETSQDEFKAVLEEIKTLH